MCTRTVHAISVTDSWQAMFMSWNRNTDVFVIFNNVWPLPNVLVLLSTVRGGPRGSVDRCSPSCSVHPLLLLHVPCHYCLLQRWGPRGRGGEGKEGRRGREVGKEGKGREGGEEVCLWLILERVFQACVLASVVCKGTCSHVLGVGVYILCTCGTYVAMNKLQYTRSSYVYACGPCCTCVCMHERSYVWYIL